MPINTVSSTLNQAEISNVKSLQNETVLKPFEWCLNLKSSILKALFSFWFHRTVNRCSDDTATGVANTKRGVASIISDAIANTQNK